MQEMEVNMGFSKRPVQGCEWPLQKTEVEKEGAAESHLPSTSHHSHELPAGTQCFFVGSSNWSSEARGFLYQ